MANLVWHRLTDYLVLREGDGEAEEGVWSGGEWQGRRGRKGKLK